MSSGTPTTHRLALASQWRSWEVALWVAALAAPAVLSSHAAVISEIAIFALFAISLDLILGLAGVVSLGHAAFFGLSAYASALFAKHVYQDPLVGLALGMTVSAALGYLCSFTVHRGTDLTRVMMTLGVALMLLELANKLDHITGGADGLQGVTIAPVLGYFEFDLAGRTAAYYSLTVLFLCFLFTRRILHSPFGAALKAIRDNSLRATAVGIPVRSRITVVYTVSAGLAGAAGALLAQTTAFASLDVFEFHRSADVLLMLVVGGAGWLYGGVLGAVVFKGLHSLLAGLTPQYWTFWMGLFLVVLVLVGRDRLVRMARSGRPRKEPLDRSQ